MIERFAAKTFTWFSVTQNASLMGVILWIITQTRSECLFPPLKKVKKLMFYILHFQIWWFKRMGTFSSFIIYSAPWFNLIYPSRSEEERESLVNNQYISKDCALQFVVKPLRFDIVFEQQIIHFILSLFLIDYFQPIKTQLNQEILFDLGD